MAELVNIRAGLASNLSKVPGLRVVPELVDNPNPPMALISLDSIDYDGAMQGGLTTYNFTISVIVGRAAEREQQRKLDTYLLPSGTYSVKGAVESDRSLSGEVYDLRVISSNAIGSINITDQTYLAAEFSVVVYA